MVFVTMGDNEGFNLVLIVYKILVVWDDVINTEEVVLREFDSSINQNDFILELDSVSVFTNFTKTTNAIDSSFVIFDV